MWGQQNQGFNQGFHGQQQGFGQQGFGQQQGNNQWTQQQGYQQGQGFKVSRGDFVVGYFEPGTPIYNLLCKEIGIGQDFNSYKTQKYMSQTNALGVTFSSTYPNPPHNNYYLDGKNKPGAWSAHELNQYQYAQITAQYPVDFLGIVLQGRHDEDQWVTKFRILYSYDGYNFMGYENGMELDGVHDRNTKKEIKFFYPINAKVLRICPTAWNGHISMRFDVVYRQGQ